MSTGWKFEVIHNTLQEDYFMPTRNLTLVHKNANMKSVYHIKQSRKFVRLS